MSREVLVQNTYARGRHDSNRTGEIIPLDAVDLTMHVERQSWPDLQDQGRSIEVMQLYVEISYDGGQSWEGFCGGSTVGGDLVGREGEPITETTVTRNLQEPGNSLRRCRGHVICEQRQNTRVYFTAKDASENELTWP